MKLIDRTDILHYEIRASWWASWVGWEPFQGWTSSYFAWKVRRKYNRYKNSLDEAERVAARRGGWSDD